MTTKLPTHLPLIRSLASIRTSLTGGSLGTIRSSARPICPASSRVTRTIFRTKASGTALTPCVPISAIIWIPPGLLPPPPGWDRNMMAMVKISTPAKRKIRLNSWVEIAVRISIDLLLLRMRAKKIIFN